MQIKMLLKIFGVGMIKNGSGQSGDRTLKLTLVPKEWTDRITDFLHVDIDSQKWLINNFCVDMVENGCDKSGHGL